MAINVRGKNLDITPALKDYVEKRVKKVTKYFDKTGDISVILRVEKGRHQVEVTVPVDGILLRGEESTTDMYASIDQVMDKLEKQIEKHKTKLEKRFRGAGFRADVASSGGRAGCRRGNSREEQTIRGQTDGFRRGNSADESAEPRFLHVSEYRVGTGESGLSPQGWTLWSSGAGILAGERTSDVT